VAVTLKDIAEEANVTLMTVSNVINGRHAKASQVTIDKVLAIADRLGYVPSAAARSLASNSSRIIGVMVHDPGNGNVLKDPYTASMVGAIEPALRQHGYHLLLQGIPDPANVPAAFRAWNLDGAIFLGFLDSTLRPMAGNLGKPLVAMESYTQNPEFMNVRLDDRDGGYQATKHLLDNGHRAIAFAGHLTAERAVNRERFEGYKLALEEAGVPVDESLLFDARNSHSAGISVGRHLKDQCPEVTAVFATADLIAIGIMEGLVSCGLNVPNDVSVVGFDDLDIATYISPKLTTVAQDLQAKAAAAVELLMDRLQEPAKKTAERVLGVQLVQRESVKKLAR
jgi:LacI family transcriptional regulator